jgi:hypothetical protein
MNIEECTRDILSIFKVSSEVNLFEAYTECWAEIMNALFCIFITLKNKNNVYEFLSNSQFFINFERTYSFFQLVKTLDFMGLSYTDLYSKSEHSRILRENLYKEKTNVLSYYIIKTVLLNNYQSFILWCDNNNLSLLQFKKTTSNKLSYCKFIEKNYKTKSMLYGINETTKFIDKINHNNKSNQNYILSNLRMTICELG